MNSGRVRNILVTEGEVTIIKAASAQDIMAHSCRLAKEISSAGVGVLVINTGLSSRRFKEAAISAGIEWQATRNSTIVINDEKAPVIIHNSEAGDLASEVQELASICEKAKIGIVIVTSWEWTSSSSRRKERLLFGLRGFMSETNAAVIVYSQSSTRTSSGYYDRGGTGKLATIAMDVVSLEAAEERKMEKTDLVAFGQVAEPIETPRVSAQLEAKEINRLPGIFANKRNGEGAKQQRRELAMAA